MNNDYIGTYFPESYLLLICPEIVWQYLNFHVVFEQKKYLFSLSSYFGKKVEKFGAILFLYNNWSNNSQIFKVSRHAIHLLNKYNKIKNKGH